MAERVVLYSRVSTQEQAQGWSIADQERAAREHAEKRGWEVVETVQDEGFSGAYPDRPGLARVMELAEAGRVDLVLATRRDRLYRSRLYRLLMDEDLAEFGVKLLALNDTNNPLADGFMDEFSAWEREQITQRTMSGKRQKARSGLILATVRPKYGFSYSEDRDRLVVDEGEMAVVRRAVGMVADGGTLNSVALAFDRDGIPTPNGARRWNVQTIKNLVTEDAYRPHVVGELEGVVPPDVLASLDPEALHGVWYFGRREYRKDRKTGRTIRRPRPKEEWIAVPVPGSGIAREAVDLARRNVASNRRVSSSGGRFWELSGGMATCAHCGYVLTTQTTKKRKTYHYYTCRTSYERGRDVCEGRLNRKAEDLEAHVWGRVRRALKHPERLKRGLERHLAKRAQDPEKARRGLQRLLAAREKLSAKKARLQHLYAEGGISLDDLRARVSEVEAEDGALAGAVALKRAEESEASELARSAEEVLAEHAALASEDLDGLTGEQRAGLYRRLGLKVKVPREGKPELAAWVDLGNPGAGLSNFNVLLNIFNPSELFVPSPAKLAPMSY